MPIYEFRCEKCDAKFELLLQTGEKLPEICDLCGGRLVKLIHAPAIQFKGSGWYVTDYAGRNSSSTKSSEKETVTPPSKETSDSKKSTQDS